MTEEALAPLTFKNGKRLALFFYAAVGLGVFAALASVVLSYSSAVGTIGATEAPDFWNLQQSLVRDHAEMKESLARIEELLKTR